MGGVHNLPNSMTQFEVALPTTERNGKYLHAEGGGFNRWIPKPDQAPAEGFAGADSDTGHGDARRSQAVDSATRVGAALRDCYTPIVSSICR
jgi:hypothetical protein